MLKAVVRLKKFAMDLDLELPEGHRHGALYVTPQELAYVIFFVQHFLETGKGPSDYGTTPEHALREIEKIRYKIQKIKPAEVIQHSLILSFCPLPILTKN